MIGKPTNSPDEVAPRWVLPVSILGSSLGFIDSSVVNVALPTIQDNLQISLATIQWVTNSYLLTLASLVLLGGALGDRYGTLKIFILGLVGFVAASVLCGLALSGSMLVASRLLQGAGAALLVPTSLALISQTYKGEARGRAIGTWAAAGGILMALGPPLGGWLIDTIGWRSIFFINVPLGGLAIVLSTLIDAGGKRRSEGRLDVSGAVLAVLALAALTYGLIAIGEARLWVGIAAVLLAIPLTAGFLFNEHRKSHPMMPLMLFGDRTFAGANALTAVLYGGLGAAIFLLPYSMIRLHHYTASEAGLGFLPLSIILGLGSRISGSFAAKAGQRLPLILGPMIAGIGFATLAVMASAEHYLHAFLPGLFLIGVGMTLAIPALTSAVFNSVPDDQNGTASGINNAAARMGSLIATAALGIAFGSQGIGDLSAQTLSGAYIVVMWTSAAAAVVSAIIAALTIQKTSTPIPAEADQTNPGAP